MESVDLAAMPFPADLKSRRANGARGVSQSNWRVALRALNRFEMRRFIAANDLH